MRLATRKKIITAAVAVFALAVLRWSSTPS